MNTIPLPALSGRIPLGFLAALGLHHLATHHADSTDVRLSWDPATHTAQLHTRQWNDVDGIADWLINLVDNLPDDQLLPSYPPGFPPPGAAPDPLVCTPEQYPHLFTDHHTARDILGALVTDLAINPQGRVRRTPMVAPTGKQTFHTMLRNQATTIRAHPEHLRDALTRWQRHPDTTAESFDHAAIIGAADEPTGQPGERAIPGATWLAIAGLPAYRLATDHHQRLTATAWRHPGKRPLLIWPLWTPPLDTHATHTLLEHPITTHNARDHGTQLHLPLTTTHRTLGIFAIYAAHRRNTGHSDGPLTPLPTT
ncbi:hypothetical protein AB0I53_19450 [Saccharopolyspora sp. NPDC050389]|uniref:type I-G CRISPR-associated protein, Cas3-extension family n=1 Tax=Saccharopolyspora sp. NPDC050389 TaxID=3155516 RepID=UPI0033FF65D6